MRQTVLSLAGLLFVVVLVCARLTAPSTVRAELHGDRLAAALGASSIAAFACVAWLVARMRRRHRAASPA